MKMKGWNTKKLAQARSTPEELTQASSISREVGLFLVQLDQASTITPRREVTYPKSN